jgi:hypothetical protein
MLQRNKREEDEQTDALVEEPHGRQQGNGKYVVAGNQTADVKPFTSALVTDPIHSP